MNQLKNTLIQMTNRAESVLMDWRIAYGLLLLAMMWIYISLDTPSVGMECLMIAGVLVAAYVRKEKQMVPVVGTLFICLCALMLLLFSGRSGERGFNAPIAHALKFVYLLFAHVMVVLMFRLKEYQRRNVMLVMMVVICISAGISLFYVTFVDVYAVRYFAERGFTQVVNFEQLYAIPFLVTAVVCLLLSKTRHIKQVLAYLPFVLLSILCVYFSLYTTALLLMVLGFGMAFLYSQFYRSPKRFWIIVGTIVLLIVLCFVFRQQVSDLLYAVTEKMNWLVKARIRSVVDMILGTSQENWYAPDRRNELAGYSLNTFLNNPVFGVGYGEYAYGVIGAHQEWYDMLGVFGVVGTVLFLGVMGVISVQTFRHAKTVVDKASFIICLTMFIVLGFLNPVLNLSVLVAVFVVAPNISALPLEWTWVSGSALRVKESVRNWRERLQKGEKK